MAYIEEALREQALADPALAAVIGDRWYGPTLEVAIGDPAITVQCISDVSEYSQAGYSGLERARYQLTVWASSHLQVIQVMALIERAFSGYRGVMGTTVAVHVGRMWKAGRTDLGREPGQKVYKSSLDFMIDYTVQV